MHDYLTRPDTIRIAIAFYYMCVIIISKVIKRFRKAHKRKKRDLNFQATMDRDT